MITTLSMASFIAVSEIRLITFSLYYSRVYWSFPCRARDPGDSHYIMLKSFVALDSVATMLRCSYFRIIYQNIYLQDFDSDTGRPRSIGVRI